MKKYISFFILFLFVPILFAETQDIASDFSGKSSCFIIFDSSHNKLIEKNNPPRCAERMTPASTFKVPLSLMVFDQKLITQNTIFQWDGKDKGLAAWNQNQTPQTWLKNSVVWVSQILAPQLGLEKIKLYLKKFHYGNQDFSGDPGQNNGVIHAWLNSSLKISADEQLTFMKALVNNELPVSQQSMTHTKTNMFLETLPNGTRFYGKIGTAGALHWFIGFLQKENKNYVIILNFSDLHPSQPTENPGENTRKIVKSLLRKLKLIGN
ncbi:MAG: penicillin binding protein transpeptidase protein [Gammaproteobacteria bacterium]|jgi:beta-lactamase class D/beta-lactamase class D OXA-1|nr:penicillin binding protein transpeptidase protein [Gammaproteobacteria bacterium]